MLEVENPLSLTLAREAKPSLGMVDAPIVKIIIGQYY